MSAAASRSTRADEDRLHRVGQLLDHRAGLDEGREQLLEEERVALGALDERRPGLGRQLAGHELVEHRRATRPGRARPARRARHSAAAAPGGPAVEQLGTSRPEHEQRPAHVVHDPLEQVEQRILGPVQVLDEDDRRRLGRQLAQQVDPGFLEELADGQRVRVAGDVEAERETEDRALAEPLPHGLLLLVLGNPELLAQDLAERPVGDVAVRKAAAGALERLRRLLGEPAPELADERRLADAGVAHQRDDVRLALLGGVTVDRLQQRQLRVAADKCPCAAAEPARPHQRQRANERLRDDGLRLALHVDLERPPELERAADGLGRARADDDRARLARLLEPRGDVDGVAGDERAALARAADDDLARVDADPEREHAVEVGAEPALHRKCGMQRPLGVVLVRLGGAEDRHDRVARELLDRAAGAVDLGGHRIVEALQERPRPLRVLLLAERRRADEVGEEHGGQLPLGGLHAPILTGAVMRF